MTPKDSLQNNHLKTVWFLHKTMNTSSNSVEIFFSYSHKDEVFREQLETHLSMLKRQGLIKPWNDRMITAGEEWKGEIDSNLNSADIVLLLISANFLASDYCYDVEMKQAMQRHEAGKVCVIPIILTPVEGWEHSPFAKLQALPKDSKPLTQWNDRDEAFVNVAQGIRKSIKLILKSQNGNDKNLEEEAKNTSFKLSEKIMEIPPDEWSQNKSSRFNNLLHALFDDK